ncbi:MAG: hypothetical protein N2654_03360 [Deltaproteobacteria bacterium]|nr:hypothetical protein [Deltaproteobacteria bacterium]
MSSLINLTFDDISSTLNDRTKLVVSGTVAASDVLSIVEWVLNNKNLVGIQVLFSTLGEIVK